MRKLALGGVFGPIIYSIVVVVAATMRPGYSHIQNFISELGATGSDNAALMNYGGFLVGGLLIASFGFSLLKILPSERSMVLVSVLVSLFGIGITASGFVSCDMGCPQGSGTIANIAHNTIAPVAFICLIVASMIFGVRWRGSAELGKLAAYSLATGVVGAGLLVALVLSLEARELTGLWQRLLLLVLFSWCVVIAIKLGTATRVKFGTH